MNELIKELADKSFVTVSSGGYFSSGEFCEKFAELIVKECVNIDFESLCAGIDAERADVVRLVIEEHFGVEG